MRFGNIPEWATDLSNSIREAIVFGSQVPKSLDLSDDVTDKNVQILPTDLLWRDPLFDQLIVNVYQPGEGICAHIDLMRFEDGIAIVSLESACVMHFSHGREPSAATEQEEREAPRYAKVGVFLNPGSLIVMGGEARYLWKHEINRNPGFQLREGKELDQKRRVSITLRKLCQMD